MPHSGGEQTDKKMHFHKSLHIMGSLSDSLYQCYRIGDLYDVPEILIGVHRKNPGTISITKSRLAADC